MRHVINHRPNRAQSTSPLQFLFSHLSLESAGELLDVVLQGAVVGKELDVGTIDLDVTSIPLDDVLVAAERSEAPVLGDNDLLPAGELVLGAAEGLEGNSTVGITSAAAHKNLTDVDTSNGTVGLAKGTTHSGLQPIGTGTRQHLVDADDVEGVGADTEVETFLTGVLDEVLVGADTRGFESLGAQLFILIGNEVNAEREVIDAGTLAAKIEDPDLGIGDTTVEPGLRVRLILAVPVAAGGTSCHFCGCFCISSWMVLG